MRCRTLAAVLVPALLWTGSLGAQDRPRARDLGIEIGRFPPGPLNAITDVEGVLVGHRTIWVGDSVRTGVTAVLPHGGNLFRDKVRAAIVVWNGFGKLVGLSQVNELGEIETPILLTGTLSVFRAADALLDTLLVHPDNGDVGSINPVVGETNDGCLSDVRARPVRPEHVREALRAAGSGPVAEGTIGAGTGTRALGWKGGIGTSSRVLPAELGAHAVGVLVQTNYGGDLTVAGLSIAGAGLEPPAEEEPAGSEAGAGGSVVIVVATDAPLAHRELARVAERTIAGIARTGSDLSHGSGDYAIAFSTDRLSPRERDGAVLSALFAAAADATEEAALNSILRATTVTGQGGCRAEAVPIDRLTRVLGRYRP